jgi:NADPH-dependent 2,4-dienoyl-CoA reductase/sulfur reductase-like enzyme
MTGWRHEPEPLAVARLRPLSGQPLSPIFVAGFYYKTFMWPAAFWEKLYEPLIRRRPASAGRRRNPIPTITRKPIAFCDVLVIGAGPAGLMAALTAARAGARVILCDEDFRPGGRLNAEAREIDGAPGQDFVARTLAELAGLPTVRVMTRSTVFGVYDSGTYGLLERVGDHLTVPAPHQPRQRLWRVVARRAVLAAGAAERPIVFGGNDRPGVMLAQAFRAYVTRYAALPARHTAFFTNNDAAWQGAFETVRAGADVAAIIDVRTSVPAALADEAGRLGIRTILGGQVVATKGKRLRAIELATARGIERLALDGLAISGGFSPNVHLTCHHGGRPVWDEAIAAFVPGRAPPGLAVAGAAAGRYGLAACLADGAAQGAGAAAELGFVGPTAALPRADDEPAGLTAFWHVAASRGSAFVDLQNDVTTKDLGIAHREGFRSVEHLKRYTTLGMATDQGKTSNLTGLAIMAELTGRIIAEAGTTIFRPPYTPVSIGALAGHHRGKDFRPIRPTPTHAWAEEQGAVFVESGPWLRAQYFPRPGEQDWLETVNREVRAVRSSVGMMRRVDLGQDRHAGAATRRLPRPGLHQRLPDARGRQAALRRHAARGWYRHGRRDHGAPRRGPYLMTTTTANAAKVYQHLEFCHQVLWPELDVLLSSVTEQWAQIRSPGRRRARCCGSSSILNTIFPMRRCPIWGRGK